MEMCFVWKSWKSKDFPILPKEWTSGRTYGIASSVDVIRMILEWSKNNNSSVESVDAVVSDKIGEIYQQQIPNAGDLTGSHGFTVHDIPNFKIKFRMTDYTEKEFDVDKKSFKNIKKGDSGVLTYQGSRYLGFIKD